MEQNRLAVNQGTPTFVLKSYFMNSKKQQQQQQTNEKTLRKIFGWLRSHHQRSISLWALTYTTDYFTIKFQWPPFALNIKHKALARHALIRRHGYRTPREITLLERTFTLASQYLQSGQPGFCKRQQRVERIRYARQRKVHVTAVTRVFQRLLGERAWKGKTSLLWIPFFFFFLF